MNQFWYDYVKPKYCEIENIHKNRQYFEKVLGLMKDELGGKIITKFVGLRAKTYIYLIVDGGKDKKAKATKKCVIKRNLNLTIIKTVQKQHTLRIK